MGKRGNLPPAPLEMLQSVLCLRSYNKMLSRRIIYVLFSQPVVSFYIGFGSGAQSLHPSGTVPMPLICPPLKKVLLAPIGYGSISNSIIIKVESNGQKLLTT